jgi:two-component system, OmpR family, sensor kinase
MRGGGFDRGTTGMSLRTRIILQLVIILAAVATMTATVVLMLASAADALNQVQAAHRQYQASVYLAEQANAYSEQIAETLLLGPSEKEDFYRARERMAQALARLRLRLDDDIAALPAGPERDRELQDLEELRAMRRTYRELETKTEQVFLLDASGQHDEARALFRDEIEDGLDLRLQRAIEGAVEGEQAEMAAADEQFEALRQRLLLTVGGVAALLFLVSGAAGFALFGAVMRPVRALSEGAQALEAGRMEHRIPVFGRDELGQLAMRFNAMAGELARQQEGLLQARRFLELQVAERTEELRTANQRLTEVDQQRVAFLADVSHELRTPLTSLRSEAEVALRGRRGEQDYRDSLQRIVEQSSEMGRLIEDLLFIARSEAGQVRFDPRRLTLDEMVEPAIRAAETVAETRGVDLAVAPIPPAWVLGDPRRLSQALLVLLDNAVRYSRPGGRVEVRTRILEDCVETVVRDWGVGLDEQDEPHLFDRFYRGRRSVEINPGGSGLGLPIARFIARRHGGDVRLEGREVGTEAVLRLPLAASGPALEQAA